MTGSFLTLGLTVFVVIFLFEIVDRTNFAMLSLAGKHPPRQVWTGAALAFVLSTAIAVGVGAVVVTLLPSYLVWVKVVGGAVLIAFGVRQLVLVEAEEEESQAEKRLASLPPRRVVLTAFALILFLEMGDNTQVLTFVFVASTGNPPSSLALLVVFVAATIALWCTSAIGALGGHLLKSRVEGKKLERMLAVILIAVGALTILFALEPGWLPAL